MPNWLLDRLFDHQDQPTPRFAFQGTKNWMRALAILADTGELETNTLKHHYSVIQRRQPDAKADTLAYGMLLMALHNAASIEAFASPNLNHYDVVRASIVAWYYSTYFACKSMVAAASGSNPQNHAKTAKIWHFDIVQKGLVVGPFRYFLNDLTPASVDNKIDTLRGQNSHDLNTRPDDNDSAYGAIISYLKGTAEYARREVEKKVRESREFRALGVDNFQTKAAREIRDKALSNEKVNFLVQAIRYRGKANYRDSIYLSYGADNSETVTEFIADLGIVATKFVTMACHFVAKRTEKGTWKSFVEDLDVNSRFRRVVDLNEI
ncbi:MAG: hypothetical protein B6D34_10515 [Candidatus Brocadia sp. UTAMX1]|jgi:hypothetical protein|nr:MAG: hypothetical protein B6D34_10515 [Candidatus Brocadia sp. UTAMX1]